MYETWDVAGSYFFTAGKNKRWLAEYRNKKDSLHQTYHVVLNYDAVADEEKNKSLMTYAEKILEKKWTLKGNDVTLTLSREVISSLEASSVSSSMLQFQLQLETRGRLSIRQEQTINLPDDYYTGAPAYCGWEQTGGDIKALLLSLYEKTEPAKKNLLIMNLVRRIMSSKKPLQVEPYHSVILSSCRAAINDSLVNIPLSGKLPDDPALRLPVYAGDSLALLPVFSLQSVMPYFAGPKKTSKPLPDFAYVRLENINGSILSLGKKTGVSGEFQTGLIRTPDLRKLKLIASLPLFPSGDEPLLNATVMIRNGREEEYFLDLNMPAPLPYVPDSISCDSVVTQVIRHLSLSVNPDEGTITGLSRSYMVDIYAFAHKELERYPELNRIILSGVKDYLIAKKNTLNIDNQTLSNTHGWNIKDVFTVLSNPSLAGELAEKITDSALPNDMYFVYTKPDDTHFNYARQLERKMTVNPETACFIALSASAMLLADTSCFNELIEKQLVYLCNDSLIKMLSRSSLETIYLTGQAMKMILNYSSNVKIRLSVTQISNIIKEELKHRLKGSEGELNNNEKVLIAHFFSDTWMPFLNIPEIFHLNDQYPFFPEQGFYIDGENLTGSLTNENHFRYKCAFYHAVDKLKKTEWNKNLKYEWINNFIDQWHNELINSRKGYLSHVMEEELAKDRDYFYKECVEK